ncbi:fasciclin domain-containing protein [Luteolibacter sp. SL250]|uniref:fasciclin domain-containing protein n=1 Tax=Luteolibacter sp. SL250 TaxID=2995170 RepID=UPI0022717A87|nr:fasciclin domain-containing protein [Luteolibacter sp. SL250]WAC19874.1 fasciclin domain-containing protein [Luteolibacter sp. SL250]
MKTTTIPKLMLILALSATPAAFAQNEAKTDKAGAAAKEEKAAPEAVKPGTVASVIADGTTFSVLAKLVKAAELEETLSGSGPFTVFAPTDEAFTKLPSGAMEKLLLPENKEKLRQLVTYHVLPGQVLASAFKDGEIKTMSGDKAKLDVDGKTAEIDEAKIVSSDVVASNGVFHSIDKVMVPKSLEGFANLDHDD